MYVKRIGIIIGMVLMAAISYGQYSQNVDTLFVKGGIKMDTNRIQEVDTAVNDYDAVPLFQIMDSIQGSISDSNYWSKTLNWLYPKTITDSVGIGTNSPNAILDVAGRIEISNTGQSVFIGEDAGLNDDLTNNNNTFIGYKSGELSTTAVNNTAVGYYSLYNPTGNYNTAIGTVALYGVSATTATHNTAVGHSSMSSITEGSYNNAQGVLSLSNLTTGDYNVAIGQQSGQNLTIGDTNVFIGSNTQPNAVGSTNEIAIGGFLVGNGTRTATIGNEYITDFYAGKNAQADVHLNGIYDSNGELGTSGQVLSSTGSAVDWVDAPTPDSINFSVDATNISQVEFVIGEDTLKESFDHVHVEYALQSQVDTIVAGSSKWTVDDSTYLNTATNIGVQGQNITGVAAVQYSPQTAPSHSEGLFYYDSDMEAFTAYNAEADISLQIGQENWKKVKNETGATIYNGQPVYVNGSTGVNSEVGLAVNSARESSIVLGIATHDIENNSLGYVTTQGEVRGLDTDGSSNFATGETWTDGDELYLSSTAGDLTNVRPTSGYCVHVGHVDYANSTNGIVFVNINIDGNLDTLMITDASGEDSVLIRDNGTKAIIKTDNYLELASDSVTLTNENGIQDGSDALVTSNEVYDYMQANTIKAYKATVTINSTAFSTLGTSPVVLIAAPGSGKFTNIINLTVEYNIVSQINVSTDNLAFSHTSDNLCYIANSTIESAVTGSKYYMPYIQGTGSVYPLAENTPFYAAFDAGNNPTSGSATMVVHIYYTIEEF